MAYFETPQIDELLNSGRTSDVIGAQPAGSQQPSEQPSAAITSAGSTSIGAAPKASAGSGNAAERGATAAQFTQVGYNPKAYQEQNQGSQQDLNLSKDTVEGAAKATQQLKDKAAAFGTGQTPIPQYSDDDIQNALGGDAAANQKLQQGLNPIVQTPEQKQPDFSSLKAPEILSSADSLAAQLKRSASGSDYTQGMADFDRALYQRSDAYKEDLGRGQKAVQDFNDSLDAEVKKWAGTDRGAELQKAQDQLKYRLKQEANAVVAGRDAKIDPAAALQAGKYRPVKEKAQEKFSGMIDAREKQIKDRLDFLGQRQKEDPSLSMKGGFNREIKSTMDALDTIKGMRNKFKNYWTKSINPGVGEANVTTQAEADRFARINDLLGGGAGNNLQVGPGVGSEAVDPEFNSKLLQQELDSIILGDAQYNNYKAPDSMEENLYMDQPREIVNNAGRDASYASKPWELQNDNIWKDKKEMVAPSVKAGKQAGGQISTQSKKIGGSIKEREKKAREAVKKQKERLREKERQAERQLENAPGGKAITGTVNKGKKILGRG